MPNRILFLVSAMLASLALPVVPNLARAADNCLTSPDKATPSGGHWRYHLERGTGRKCWYLADEAANTEATKADAGKPDTDDPDATGSVPPRPAAKIVPSLERAAASPPDRPRATKPAVPPVAQAPASNARAEYLDAPGNEQPAPAAPAQPDVPQAAAPNTPWQGSVATRWPSPGSTVAADSNSPPAAVATPASGPRPNVEPKPAASADQATPAAPADPTTPPPADAARGPDYLLYALIAAVTGFAAVVGFAGLRFFAEWWRDWREEQRWRRSQQPSVATRGPSMMAIGDVPMGLARASETAIPRARQSIVPEEPPRRLEDEIDEVEQLLALTRQASGQLHGSSWDAHAARDAAE
jgi:hypothetical protein